MDDNDNDNTISELEKLLIKYNTLKSGRGNLSRAQSIEQTIQSLQDIIDCMPGNVYWLTKDCRVAGCNQNVLTMFGLNSIEQFKGLTFEDMERLGGWSKEAAEKFKKDSLQVIKTGIPLINTEEPPIPDNENKMIYFLTSRVPLFDEQKNVIGVVGISVDITELKATQNALEQAKKVIEKEKIKAEAASQAKSDFIANMSHDIRTPITGMIGMIQDLLNAAQNIQLFLQDGQQTDFGKKQCVELLKKMASLILRDGDFLMGATDELLQLCNEILETVSLESGKFSEKIESFDLRELIQHNCDLLRPVAQHRQLDLIIEVADDVPRYLKGLRAYLDRTLLNLLSNALKFTEEGFVKVTVTANDSHPSMHQNGVIELIITVEDSGMGIPEDKFGVIFEHFSRLNPSSDGLYKGSGLGLYTVKQYVHAMKGAISVNSKVGKGTQFKLQIPFAVSDHSDAQRHSIRPTKILQQLKEPDLSLDFEQATETPAKDVVGCILVVEDNAAAAMAIKSTLHKYNCAIELAKNGQEALEKAQQGHYDLILMDIGLPDSDGLTVTRQIRALAAEVAAQVPIVALTGHFNKRDECIAAGMQDLLVKPAQPLALESILKRFIFSSVEEKKQLPAAVDKDQPQALAVIDWPACVHMCGGDEEGTQELLAVCVEELKTTQTILQQAYQAQDTHALREELHRCLGGVCYLRLPQLEQALKTFQTAVKAEQQDPVQLAATYEALTEAMQRFLEAYQQGCFKVNRQ